jgi:hypothetical protein
MARVVIPDPASAERLAAHGPNAISWHLAARLMPR